ncbi:MAG: adenosylcobinamide-GDP ribazoletransferase [Deltaproteobacteria bacterium]|jgi:adenosylcobinamide-GDP ribazoletransferase|nr:adenosylcobinamide-GDP ribazoletransferase [Deltaproteobacteria bacterium]
MQLLSRILENLRNSLAFLTLIPIGQKKILSDQEFGRLPGYFPLVGLCIGVLTLVLALMIEFVNLPKAVIAIFLVAFQVILTRGFHLDGLADTADALLSHRSIERKLEILKDSHLGTFGVLAIVLDVLLKASLLASLENAQGGIPASALLLFPIWGRLAASVVAATSTYARPSPGLGYNMVAHSTNKDLAFAVFTTAFISIWFGPLNLLIAAIVALFGAALVWVWKKALGGVTGDLLGASVELGEIFSLILFSILFKI